MKEQLPSVDDFVKSASCQTVKTAAGGLLGWMAKHPGLTIGVPSAVGLGAGALHGLLRTPDKPSDEVTEAAPMGMNHDILSYILGSKGPEGGLVGGLMKGFGTELGRSLVDLTGNVAKSISRAVRGSPIDDVIANDPYLTDADPEVLQDAYSTMQRFAPTLATDKGAVQAFLREAATSGGGVNYNTIKLLSDAERSAQEGGSW